MASIGPQLPPDLTKRKRTSPSPNPSSPPAKQARHSPLNTNEIDLSDSDSDYGPSAPANTKATIGPSLPSTKQNDQEIDLSSDSDTGPKPQAQPQPQPRLADSDSDSDYGPSLPTSTSKRPTQGPSLPTSQAPQRDTWMLAPPTSTSYTERDPTRMRNRKFASKPSTASPSTPTIWTETPEEKLKRQKDALLGRTTEATAPRHKTEQDERDRKIAENIEAHRGKSLYDEHATKRKGEGTAAEEDDDPSKRAFDREKDMALGGKIGEKQRRELISKSAGFGGRFQKGSFL